MHDRIVIDTGPLITLARIGALDIPGRLPFEFICPVQVRNELDDGSHAGHPDVRPPWLAVEALRSPASALAMSALDAGEAAVIQLALERDIAWVCIDEWKGRRAALAAGLRVTGVLGLLGQAKKHGIVSAVKPFIQKARAEGIRYDAVLVAHFLEAVGE